MLRRWPLLVLLAAFLLTAVLFAVSQSEPMPSVKKVAIEGERR